MKNIKIAYSKEYILPLPSDHKFPIQKYKLIPEKLLDENVISEANLFIPSMAKREIVELTHTSEYIRRERKGFYIQHAR